MTLSPGNAPDPILFRASVTLTPDATGVETMHAVLETFWQEIRHLPGVVQPDTAWRNEFTIAVAEIGSNIIRHSLSLETESSATCQLDLVVSGAAVEAMFRNAGAPFTGSIGEADPPLHDVDLFALPEGQFGIGLARRALDDLRYEQDERGFNIWTLMKMLPTHHTGE